MTRSDAGPTTSIGDAMTSDNGSGHADDGQIASFKPRQPKSERNRYRVRFRKQGLLRFVSHNDLLRTWDRLLRRTGLPLKSTEGFHAKTKLSSPIPLALGLEGVDEVLDVELLVPLDCDDLQSRLQDEAVPGLCIASIRRLPESRVSSVVDAVEYICQVDPKQDESELSMARDRFLASESWLVERRIPGKPTRQVDIRSKVETIAVDDAEIRFRAKVENGATVRPEELLGALGLAEQLREGRIQITRTRVEVADSKPVRCKSDFNSVAPPTVANHAPSSKRQSS